MISQVTFLAEEVHCSLCSRFFLESLVMSVWGQRVNVSILLSHGVDTIGICSSGEGLYSPLRVFETKPNR